MTFMRFLHLQCQNFHVHDGSTVNMAPTTHTVREACGSSHHAMRHTAFATTAHTQPSRRLNRHVWALLIAVAITLLTVPLHGTLDLANIVMLDLLAVVVVASRLGRGPAVVCALVSVALFDYAHVPPRWSFAVGDLQYLVTLLVMLTVALTIGQLTHGLRQRAIDAQTQTQRTRAMYDLARQLAGAMTLAQAQDALNRFATTQLDAHCWVLLPADRLGQALAIPAAVHPGTPEAADQRLDTVVLQVAQALHRRWPGHPSRQADVDGRPHLLLPLAGSTRSRGVLVLRPQAAQHPLLDAPNAPMLDALATLVATSLERLHFVDVAHRTQLEMNDERLRGSILSALSHDVRTPLTSLVGSAEALSLMPTPLPAPARELVDAMRDQALRLHHMVSNLLDMARLQRQQDGGGGHVLLRPDWQPIEEVIGASIQLLGTALSAHPVQVTLPPGQPLVHIDAVLMERVFGNLLENAAKYSPPGPIGVNVTAEGAQLRVSVHNGGPGFPPHKLQQVFDVFERGEHESTTPGMGLGLSICRAIVEAHGGRIRADNPIDGGARITFTLPLGTPPGIETEAQATHD
jgi:two-component system sensor histidine kinase KdpD